MDFSLQTSRRNAGIVQTSKIVLVARIILAVIFFNSLVLTAAAQTKEGTNCNVGLIYPISSNGYRAKEYSNYFSLNAIAGVSRSETGTSIAGLSNIILDNASGCQIAGFSNYIYNHARGVQVAGFMNYTRNSSTGVQVAGFINITGSEGKGTVVSGFGNFCLKNSAGTQVAGFMNAAMTGHNQVAGFLNIADNVNTQVAGFINVARKVRGAQIAGFINIADSSDYPIGIVNLIRHGEKAIGVSTDETLTTLVSFRSGGRKLYGIAGLGYNNKGPLRLAAWEAGIGAHWKLAESFRLNTELVTVGLTDFEHGDYLKSSFRLLPALRLQRHLEIFAGPSFNHVRSNKGVGEDLVSHYLWSDKGTKDFHGLYFGFTGGISVTL